MFAKKSTFVRQSRIMETIRDFEPVTRKKIMEEVELSLSACIRGLKALRNRNYIKMHPYLDDRRIQVYTMTEKARDVFATFGDWLSYKRIVFKRIWDREIGEGVEIKELGPDEPDIIDN